MTRYFTNEAVFDAVAEHIFNEYDFLEEHIVFEIADLGVDLFADLLDSGEFEDEEDALNEVLHIAYTEYQKL